MTVCGLCGHDRGWILEGRCLAPLEAGSLVEPALRCDCRTWEPELLTTPPGPEPTVVFAADPERARRKR